MLPDTEEKGPGGAEPLRRRRRILLAVVLAAILASVGGLGAATFVKSPQELAAEAGPPRASSITYTVERRVLRQTVTLRGTVAPGRTIEISPVVSAEAGKAVVSAPPLKAGAKVSAGKVLAVVSGRPIIALSGKVPAYRDLHDGYSGADVQQLQTALRGLGYPVGDSPGRYGASTQAAVKRMYVDRGFEPVGRPSAGSPSAGDQAAGGQAGGGSAKTPAKARQEIVLPSGEVQFVPRFPARVTEVKAHLGVEVKGVLMKIATGDLVVRGSLSAADRKLVRAGKPVKIFSEEIGQSVNGVVATVGGQRSGEGGGAGAGGEGDAQSEDGAQGEGEGETPEQGAEGYPIVVRGVRPLSERFAGQDVRLTINAASTKEAVLVVPASAIYAVAEGSLQVIKAAPDGSQIRLAVTTGATGGGFVEVSGGGLAEGDKVVVGASR